MHARISGLCFRETRAIRAGGRPKRRGSLEPGWINTGNERGPRGGVRSARMRAGARGVLMTIPLAQYPSRDTRSSTHRQQRVFVRVYEHERRDFAAISSLARLRRCFHFTCTRFSCSISRPSTPSAFAYVMMWWNGQSPPSTFARMH